ncbi:MAG: UDP-2,3-diacylglucosamine diphosphatase LpxI [Planctomycetota bacterium]|nr:UDP-2,3-diacylglucosamine diphosphatase LpxI [Planctomycetota bacterium]
MTGHQPIIGMIAGNGILPILVARGAREAGYKVCCIGLSKQFRPELPSECDVFKKVGLAKIGSWVRQLKKWDVEDAVMVGGVGKQVMHDPLRLFRIMPDAKGLLLWYRTLRHDRRDATVLSAIADELARSGVTLIDSTTHIQEHLAGPETLGSVKPSTQQQNDIAFGWPLLSKTAGLHIGQSMAVREGDVIAVEAIEGTAALIQRAGTLCKRNGWTLIKTAADDHDMRADVPSIGVEAIKQCVDAGCGCIAVGTGRVILLDSPEVIKVADAANIAIVGVAP